MNPTVVVLASVAGMAIFVAVSVPLMPRRARGGLERIRDHAPVAGTGSASARHGAPSDMIRATLQSTVGSRIEKSDRGHQLVDRLAMADIKLRPAEWLLAASGVSAAVGGLMYLRFGSPVFLAIGGGLGWIAANFFLTRRNNNRRKAFDAQLSPTVLAISSAIKAGYTFGQAVDLVSKNAGHPMNIELTRVTREVQLGVPLIDALERMVLRNDSEDLRLMLTAVQIQTQVGGNLAEVLDSIEFTIRERIRIKGEIRTLTGQARASGWILIVLPFALAGILYTIAPTYFSPMFTDIMGQVMLGIAVFAIFCGYLIIRKIVNVKV